MARFHRRPGVLGFAGERHLGRLISGEHADRVAQIVDVAECVGPHLVPHQPLERLRERGRLLLRHRQVLILLLTEEAHVVGDVDRPAIRIGVVGATAVVDAAAVEEHRALRHLGGDRVLERESQPAFELIAPDHDAGRTVFLGEVVAGPDRVALHVVAGGEREEVECPLVSMDRLRLAARSDVDDLGEVELVTGDVPEEVVARGDDRGVHHEFLCRCRAGEQATGSSSGEPGEAVAAVGGGVDEGLYLVEKTVEQAGVDHLVDDDRTVAAKHLSNLSAGGGRGQVDDLHGSKCEAVT